MFIHLDETLQLALDCVAIVGPGRGIAYGWAMTPRDADTDLAVSAGPDGDCPIDHCSFHARPDVVPSDPGRTAVNGFTISFEIPEDPRELVLTVTAGDRTLRANLLDPRINGDLFKATADRAWRVTFGMMCESAGSPAMAGLMRYQGRPFGAFADWISRLPVVRGRTKDFGKLAEVEAVSTAAGEALVMLRAGAALPPEAEIEAAAICWLQSEGDSLPEPMLVQLADWHAVRLPAALAAYGRVEPGLLARLHSIELILRAELRPGEEVWLRVQPATGTVPDLLDTASRVTMPGLALPVEAAASAGLELLKQVVARREAAFGPTLAALSGANAPQAAGRRQPRLALILGVDDPMAARLFHVTAGIFERHCDTLLVMGSAADDIAQAFTQRGKLRVLVGVEAAQTLREAAGRAGVMAVEASSFAEAVIAGTEDAVFARPLDAADVARLLALHAAAGCTPALADSLQRLLRARSGESRFAPLQRGWTNRHAAAIVNEHLQRLWAVGGAAPALPEPALHG